MAEPFVLGLSLLEAQDVRGVMLRMVDAAGLCQLKAASGAWCTHARRELCTRLCSYEGANITGLDVACLNGAGRSWEVVIAGRQLTQLARLRGFGFVVDVQAVREANLHAEEEDDEDGTPLGGETLRSCIQGEGDPSREDPPRELLLAAVACAACGLVHGVPVEQLRQDDAIGSLDLFKSDLVDISAVLLGFMLPAVTSVRSLSLGVNDFGVEGVTKLAEVLSQTKITTLDLRLNTLQSQGAAALAEGLKGNLTLKELDIGSNRIGVEGCKAVAAVLKETQITNLNLYNNDLGPEGGVALAEGIKGNSTLKELNLTNNAICGVTIDRKGRHQGTYTTEGITKLCEGLKGSAVTSLNLGGNDIGPEGGAALAEGLKGNSTLRSLNLASNKLCGLYYDVYGELMGTYTAEGIMKLCKALKGSAVTSLNLNGNDIGPQGGKALAESLKGNSTITSLSLEGNELGPEGVAAIAEGLKGNSTLQSLNLAGNWLCGLDDDGNGTYTMEGIIKLCEGLKGSAVASLNLDNNQLCGVDWLGLGTYTVEGITKLCEGLKGSAVISLSLQRNYLTDEDQQGVKDATGSSVQIRF